MKQSEWIRHSQAISDNGAETYWDKTTSQNYGTYEGDGTTYQIWLEDSKSIAEKVKLIPKYKLARRGGMETGI